MLVGYARVSTAGQSPDHQVDALQRVGVKSEDIPRHTANGAKASRPKLTPDQTRQAQRLYDESEHTVQQIADMFCVKRGTLYGHLDQASIGTRPRSTVLQ